MKSPATPLACHSKPPIKGKELLSKTPKSTTSDSDRDSSAFAKPQNDNGIESARNPSRDASQKAHRDSSPAARDDNNKITFSFLAIVKSSPHSSKKAG